MSKKPMTWLGLIKEKLADEKAKGNAPSINDIMPIAKKEWAQIKDGKHPKYEQGKAQTFARKNKGDKKTKKNKSSSAKSSSSKSSSSKSSSAKSSSPAMQTVLHEAKLCNKCKKKVEKVMKKKGMSGGNFGDNAAMVGGTCGGTCTQAMNGGSCGGSCCGGPM
jgi:hypothetical protein